MLPVALRQDSDYSEETHRRLLLGHTFFQPRTSEVRAGRAASVCGGEVAPAGGLWQWHWQSPPTNLEGTRERFAQQA